MALSILLANTASTAAPLPPPRPKNLGGALEAGQQPTAGADRRHEPPPPRITDEEKRAADDACTRLAGDGTVVGKRLDSIEAPDGCSLYDPLRLEAVLLADGTKVPLEPAPVMRCLMAEAVAAFVRADLVDVAAKAGGRLVKIHTAAAYECRGRNRVKGAKLSEHGRGNALDIRAIVLNDRRVVAIAPKDMPLEAAETWRARACTRFTTVLGPGSDAYHDSHLHIDLAKRRGDYRICQWAIPPTDAVAETSIERTK